MLYAVRDRRQDQFASEIYSAENTVRDHETSQFISLLDFGRN